jgi:hypothetical protein
LRDAPPLKFKHKMAFWIYLIKGPVEEKLLPALSVPIEVEVPLLLAMPLPAILDPSVFFIDCVKAACSD